jgi:hypothetical protein
MSSMRQVARAAFRFAAAVEPPPEQASRRPRSLLDPRHLARAGLLTARFGSELLDRLWNGPEAAIRYTELDDKVRAFHFFESVVAHLELGQGPLAPAQAIRDAQDRLGHEQAVWATEGIGYELYERRRKTGQAASGLLRGPGDGIPDGSWTVLHTGMGMALAEDWLGRASGSPASRLADDLAEHLRTCDEAARPGYAELVFEPLGLVARLLHSQRVPAIGAQLERVGQPWSDLFWHGVGRGLYFLPANLPPGRSAPWAGLDMCRREPPHETGRRNAAAGFSWAVSLVNLRRPAVVESFLARHAAADDAGDPVAQGVLSALLLWHETTRGSKELRRFVEHVAAPERRGLWLRIVRAPFDQALRIQAAADAPHDARHVSALFRYR